MKKSELKKLIRKIINEQKAKSPRVIYNPTPEQIGVSQEEYEECSKIKDLIDKL